MERTGLGTRSWTELTARPLPTLLVPIGAIEQHGPHLPLDTDVRIATAVARQAAPTLHALVAPPLNYGSSGEHQDFVGTISLGATVVEDMVVEYGRSAGTWAGRVVFVNGHGGNRDPLVAAVRRLRYEGRDAAWFACAVAPPRLTDTHAGEVETALLLHLSPELVRHELASPGNSTPLPELMPQLVTGGVRSVSENGVLGDPSGATAQQGRALLNQMVADLTAAVDWWQVDDGRLGGSAQQRSAGV